MENDRFDGSFDKSVLRFQRHGLQRAELQFDSQPIIGHPLKMTGKNCNQMFMSYLLNTNRFLNPFATGSLTQETFEEHNFLIFTNLKNDGYKHGQLTLKLNFGQNPVGLFIENLFIAHQYVMDVHLLLRYEGNYIT